MRDLGKRNSVVACTFRCNWENEWSEHNYMCKKKAREIVLFSFFFFSPAVNSHAFLVVMKI